MLPPVSSSSLRMKGDSHSRRIECFGHLSKYAGSLGLSKLLFTLPLDPPHLLDYVLTQQSNRGLFLKVGILLKTHTVQVED